MLPISESTGYKIWFAIAGAILLVLCLGIALELSSEGAVRAEQVKQDADALASVIDDRVHLELKRVRQISDLISFSIPPLKRTADVDITIKPWLTRINDKILKQGDISIAYLSLEDSNAGTAQVLISESSERLRPIYKRWLDNNVSDEVRITFLFTRQTNIIDIYTIRQVQRQGGLSYSMITRFRMPFNIAAYLGSAKEVFIVSADHIAMALHDGVFAPIQLYTDTAHIVNNDKDFITSRLDYMPLQSVTLESVEEDGIRYTVLNGEHDKRYYSVSYALERRGYDMILLFDAQPIQDGILEELFEGLQKIAVVLLILLILTCLVYYHFTVRKLNYLDPLTQLHNRRYFNESISRLLELHERKKLDHLGVIMIDIDYFKKVNDEFGHSVGDQVLKIIAAIINETIRKSDLAYRFGGEEFVVLCVGEDETGLVNLAERIRQAVETEQYTKNILPNGFRVSLGVAERCSGEAIDAVLERADQKLYEAKEGGRNRVCH